MVGETERIQDRTKAVICQDGTAGNERDRNSGTSLRYCLNRETGNSIE